MGYLIDSLDICYGIQLADSRGDVWGNLCIGVDACFYYLFSDGNFGEQYRSGVPPPQASIATKNQSGPCSGSLPEGGSLTGGHLHHLGALHDEEGVVFPRG